jgi:hypothetical protein
MFFLSNRIRVWFEFDPTGLKSVFLHKFKKWQPTTKKRQPTTMLSAQKRVAKKKGAMRTSLGRSLEATANSLQAARALGDITNLIYETLLAYDKGDRRKVKSCMELVNKALPIVQRVISVNISKACPKVGAGANSSVSRINSEEKKRKTIEQPLKMGQSVKQWLPSDSYTYVSNIVKDHKAKVLSSDLPSPCSRYALPKSELEPSVTPPSTRPETQYSLAAFPVDDATPEFPKPVDGNAQFFPAEVVVSILDSFGEGKAADKKAGCQKCDDW